MNWLLDTVKKCGWTPIYADAVVADAASSDLHNLSTQQLVDLINRANSELANRAGR